MFKLSEQIVKLAARYFNLLITRNDLANICKAAKAV